MSICSFLKCLLTILCSGTYSIRIRQCPDRAKLAISKSDKVEKDRKPVDPPPIIQMRIDSDVDRTNNYLQSPYFFMSVTLWDPEENRAAPWAQHATLAGTLVSSLHRLKDIDDNDGGFFVFGDLSVKIEGWWRLCFDLFQLRDGGVHKLNSIVSLKFRVFSAKEFPGMSQSTHLSRSFGEQGVKLRLRKEQRSAGRKRTATMANLHPDPAQTMGVGLPAGYPMHFHNPYMHNEAARQQQQQQQQQQPYASTMLGYPQGPPVTSVPFETYAHGEANKRQRMSLDMSGQPHTPTSPARSEPPSQSIQTLYTPQSQPHSHNSSVGEGSSITLSPMRSDHPSGYPMSMGMAPVPILAYPSHQSLSSQGLALPALLSTQSAMGSNQSLLNSSSASNILPSAFSANPLQIPQVQPQPMSAPPAPYTHHPPQPQSMQQPNPAVYNPPPSLSLISPRREAAPILTTSAHITTYQPSPIRHELPAVLLASPTRPLLNDSGPSSATISAVAVTAPGQAAGCTAGATTLTLPPLQPPGENVKGQGPVRSAGALNLGPPSKFESASVMRGVGGGNGGVGGSALPPPPPPPQPPQGVGVAGGSGQGQNLGSGQGLPS